MSFQMTPTKYELFIQGKAWVCSPIIRGKGPTSIDFSQIMCPKDFRNPKAGMASIHEEAAASRNLPR